MVKILSSLSRRRLVVSAAALAAMVAVALVVITGDNHTRAQAPGCPAPVEANCDFAIDVLDALVAGDADFFAEHASATSTICPTSPEPVGPSPVCNGHWGEPVSGFSIGRYGSTGVFVSQADFLAYLADINEAFLQNGPDQLHVAGMGCPQPGGPQACNDVFAVTLHAPIGTDHLVVVLLFRRSGSSEPSLIGAYNWALETPAHGGGFDALGDLWTGESARFHFYPWGRTATPHRP